MSILESEMTTTALAQWYGSARLIADEVGRELAGRSWVGVPFAGGMCELARIGARSMLVNDLHLAVINMARVAGDRVLGPQLYRQLRRQAFHPDVLAVAQDRCRLREAASNGWLLRRIPDPDKDDRLEWAIDYFICTWMGRGGSAGAKGEFNGALSIRYNANGGDSNTRFRSATDSLPAWRRVLRRCNFTTVDAIEFVNGTGDDPDLGIYCDPPFPGPGDLYKIQFPIERHRQLANALGRFRHTRVVCRYYDVDLVRELYPEDRWTWRRLEGRKRTNGPSPEVLILNGPSRSGGR